MIRKRLSFRISGPKVEGMAGVSELGWYACYDNLPQEKFPRKFPATLTEHITKFPTSIFNPIKDLLILSFLIVPNLYPKLLRIKNKVSYWDVPIDYGYKTGTQRFSFWKYGFGTALLGLWLCKSGESKILCANTAKTWYERRV